MGRRARTNCCPVDSVLEKYHSDIGNRLSAVFIPPPATVTEDNTNGLCDELNMLTLNFRRASSLKHTSKPSSKCQRTFTQKAIDTCPKIVTDNANSQQNETTVFNPSHTSNESSTQAAQNLSEVESSSASKDRVRLVDKLTRALFQKRHICARCKRKSRSCIVNKTLVSSEKRYTCGRCRENSSALKNFFDSPSEKQTQLSHSTLSSASSSGLKPRAGNDSGYETVTSCSTLASSYSAFNTSNSNQLGVDKDTKSQGVLDSSFETLNPSKSNPEFKHIEHAQDHLAGYSDPSDCTHQQRKVPPTHEYDGYLPDFIEFRGWNANQTSSMPCGQTKDSPELCYATANYNDEDDDDEQDVGGVMIVRKPTSLGSNPGHKACHTCGATSVTCFRLPWEGGWICEDCMDGIY